MSDAPAAPEVRHLPEANRFEAVVDGHVCRLDYLIDDGTMRIHHTEVPYPLEGRGIAAALTRTAIDHARASGLRVQPLCSYVRTWLRRHPEHADLLAG
ncbi:MAG: N-acetyltransferase [Burkholderiales bacterium]|nr:MAG: N-acetyltransferase [Burkholderiales bacterium]